MIKVKKMPPDTGPAAWNTILPERTPNPSLNDQINADYLVIGAGFAGLSAARRLTQLAPNARIVVLEGREVATGPAGRNSGFMIDLPHELTSDDYAGESAENDRRQTAINRTAIEFAKSIADDFGLSEEAITVSGKINAAATTKGLKHNADYAEHLTRLGEAFKLLDATEMQTLTGSEYYQGGLWTPGTAMLQPALYIRGLAEGLQRQSGMELYEQSPVTSLDKNSNGWLVKTPEGSVQASKVIIAVNGLIEHFGFYSGRLMHLMLYGSMTRALTPAEVEKLGGEPRWGFTPADPLGTTVRRISGIGGDRIIIRNCATYDPKMTSSDAKMRSIAQTHIDSFKARFPMLSNVEMEHCWDGRLCLSLNSVYAIGEVDDGLYSACCQNGLGTAKGTAAGIIAAEQAAEASETLLPDYQIEAAPTKLPPEPLMWLGANSVMKWKEFRAGKEF